MKNSNLYKVLLGVLGVSLLVSFNNCSKGFQTSDIPEAVEETFDTVSRRSSGSASLASTASDQSSRQAQNSGQSTTTQSGSSSPASSSSSAAVSAASIKVHTSNSLAGPWVENGKICRNQVTYVRTSGVNLALKTKGCASPSNSNGCMDLNSHREFTSAEVSSGSIITSVSVAESNSWPLGSYAFFISQKTDNNTVVLKTVGSASLENCASAGSGSSSGGSSGSSSSGSSGSSTPAVDPGVNPGNAPGCRWSNLSFGGGSVRKDPSMACTVAKAWQSAVDGNGVNQTCTCDSVPAPQLPTYGSIGPASYSEYHLTWAAAMTGNGQQQPLPVGTQCAYGATYSGYMNCAADWTGPEGNRYKVCQGWAQSCN